MSGREADMTFRKDMTGLKARLRNSKPCTRESHDLNTEAADAIDWLEVEAAADAEYLNTIRELFEEVSAERDEAVERLRSLADAELGSHQKARAFLDKHNAGKEE